MRKINYENKTCNFMRKILTFIEIQMDIYFRKDDIIRVDDFYGRK